MPELYGQRYSRAQLLERVGRIEQIGGVEPCVLTSGRAEGVRALHVTTGAGLAFTALPDRCLDIPAISFHGRSLCWHAANGMVSPQLYEPAGNGFLRSFFGGLLTTCGLRNSGPPCEVDGESFTMHGRIGNLPAGDVAWGSSWEGDECVIWMQGTVRESRVFGEDLTLHRRIETRLGSATLNIQNTVRNEGWRDEGHMILFHMNAGFPLLDEGTRLLVDPLDVRPRDEEARKGLDVYDRFSAPQAAFKEQVFILDLKPDAEGYVSAACVNERLDGGLGLRLRWRKDQLPWMMAWRQMGQGVYVLGMEPANCPTIEGRAEAVKRGTLPLLRPGEERRYDIEVTALAGRASWEKVGG